MAPPRWVLLGVALSMALGHLPGCKKDDDDGPPNARVEAIVTDPSAVQKNEVSLTYSLVDPDSNRASIEVRYSTDGGATFDPNPATEFGVPGGPSDGTINLATSPSPGTAHTFIWDTLADLGPLLETQVQLRVTPSDSETGIAGTTASFAVNNAPKPPPWVTINSVFSPQNGDVRVIYRLLDNLVSYLAITVEYSLTGGPPFLPATEIPGLPSDGTTGLRASPPPGMLHNFFWDTLADGVGLGATPDTAVIRITPYDTSQAGLPVLSNSFDVNNSTNTPPSVVITQPTPGPLPTGDVDIDYDLIDPESNRIAIGVEFSTDAGVSFAPASRGSGSDLTWHLTSSPTGVSHRFVWATLPDVGAANYPQCRIRIIPSDGAGGGVPGETADFAVTNLDTVPPEVTFLSDAATITSDQRIVIEFSEPLDPATVILGTIAPATLGVVQDNDTTVGGDPCLGLGAGLDFSEVPGQILFEAQGSRVIFFPYSVFRESQEVRLVLTSGITDLGAIPLWLDPVSPPVASDPYSLDCLLSPQVFEDRFLPGAIPRCARFLPDPDSDIWHYDFDTFGTFDADLGARGLQTATPADPENVAARDRVIAAVLSTMSDKYNRDPVDGSAQPGAWKISFACAPPPGAVLGQDYSRMCVGLNLLGAGVLGRAWLDPGNTGMEDDCVASGTEIGVFSGGINGTNSTLSPALASGDLMFLDDSYTLGSGTPSEDARFLAVRDVILDWGHAVGVVGAHETGHSVGLQHDDTHSLNIMRTSVSSPFLSSTSVRFSAANAAILDTNLGVVP